MNYHELTWDYDNLKVIGHNPQIEMKKGYNPTLPNSFWQVKSQEFPDFEPNLELELHKKAKVTDYIEQIPPFGMLINEPFKNILTKFNLPPHKFYPIKVFSKGKLLKYYWFHWLFDIFEHIDLQNSTMQVYKRFEFKVEKILPIVSLDNVKKLNSSLPRQKETKVNTLFFKKDVIKYDVINIREVDYYDTIISKRLLIALKDAGMTGFTYKLYDKIR